MTELVRRDRVRQNRVVQAPNGPTVTVVPAAGPSGSLRDALHRLVEETYSQADHDYLDKSLRLLRFGLIATRAACRRRGIARALLGRAFAVLAARGDTSVVGDVDDTNVVSLAFPAGFGARRYGGSVKLIRRLPGRTGDD